MELKRYGFILKGPGYDPEEHRAVLDSGSFRTQVVAVSSTEQACAAARILFDQGIQILELCGGFDQEAASRVVEALEGRIPVGRVVFDPVEARKAAATLTAQDHEKAPTEDR